MKYQVKRGGNRGGSRAGSGHHHDKSRDVTRRGDSRRGGDNQIKRGGQRPQGKVSHQTHKNRSGAIHKGPRHERGGHGHRGGKKDHRREDRLPKDPKAAQDKLDEQLLRFQQKHGVNVDQLQKLQQSKLDAQLKEFMEKAKEKQ